MSLRTPFAVRPNRALLRESVLVTAVLGALALWRRVVHLVADSLVPILDPLSTVAAFVAGGVAAGGRSSPASLSSSARTPPDAASRRVRAPLPREDLRPLALNRRRPRRLRLRHRAGRDGHGRPVRSLTRTHYGPSPSLVPLLATVGVHVAVLVPGLALVCQGVVQGSLRRVFDGPRAVVATTLVAGFALTGGAGRLTAVPEAGKLAGVVVFVALLALTVLASERIAREDLRPLASVPVALFVALAVGSGLTEIDSLAGGLFAVTHLAVLGVAAYGYDRSDSLLVPAFAYLCLSLSNAAVVVAEGGSAPPF
ncbi:hypothetical protein [Halogeometricum sp. CBA1124]|uniref:hypothetical protein n=1 Tax=Halogeometricum sp. CBA1124 TaxID=2668071 RepID=UPI00142AE950|nr:hypothetical protein [Halogeometricum sp. CBA1124]MUV58874.1 hypothetical protein [Halogeometricum sp. CBA1124]